MPSLTRPRNKSGSSPKTLAPWLCCELPIKARPFPSNYKNQFSIPLYIGKLHYQRAPKKGLGLGLFIVKEIVTGHEGIVDVASTEAQGTTFTVRLPRISAPVPN
jgi:hypothetical protein